MVEVNLPVWSYYPDDDSGFVDPLYAPYQRSTVSIGSGGPGEMCPVNTFARQGEVGLLVREELVRKGKGLSFALAHPDTDSCPAGWTKDPVTGYCDANVSEYGNHGLYSKDAFVAKYQYWAGYTSKLTPADREISSMEGRSVNPFTGSWVQYLNPRPSESTTRYGRLKSRDSFLA